LLETLEDRCLLATSFGFLQTNLVSDVPGMATITDPNLINPWGLTAGPGGPFWVSDNGTGVSTLYGGDGEIQNLVVTIPTAAGNPQGPTGSPSGIVFNGTGDFTLTQNGVSGVPFFIFATEDGTIAGWAPDINFTTAITAVDNGGPANQVDYTGLALANNGSGNFLYVADAAGGAIHVFDHNFKPATLSGSFTDPTLPAGYTPYNIQNIGGVLYVTFTNQSAGPGLGNGQVDAFDTNGHLIRSLTRGGNLNQPWGLAIAPPDFGQFGGALLVGNKGDGHIDAYNPVNGDSRGQILDPNGNPITIPGLWGLDFGNADAAGDPDTLFFNAGINNYAHGLFGSIQVNRQPVANHRIGESIIPNLPVSPSLFVSTNSPTGDQNPYGIAYVPSDYTGGGTLHPGDLLVSNFNNNQNLQGTGSTIMDVAPNGTTSVFFQGPSGIGLTTALGVLKSGFVLVGNTPTTDGTSNTIQPGSLIIVNSSGTQVANLTDPNNVLIDGPWDLTVNDQGTTAQVFVSNVLNGTVTRIDLSIPSGQNPSVVDMVQVASGYAFSPNQFALVIGPTGLAYDPKQDILYVASTQDNAIYGIGQATKRTSSGGLGHLIYQDSTHLHGPLGLVLAPNGDLITANGDAVNADPTQPSEIVEFTTQGQFVGQISIDPAVDAAFGIAFQFSQPGNELNFAAVDDNHNTTIVWTIDVQQHNGFSTVHKSPSRDTTGNALLAAVSTAPVSQLPHGLTTSAVVSHGQGSTPSNMPGAITSSLSSSSFRVGLALAEGRLHRRAVDLAFADGVDLFDVL
jgi:uncharacterized protein (TIGR03118 family)